MLKRVRILMSKMKILLIAISIAVFLPGCADYSKPIPGKDKQGAGLVSGAMMGAGSGIITGAQFGAATGPGAFIGMGFGALWGSLQRLGLDLLEDEDFRILMEVAKTDDEVLAQYTLLEHFEIKSELHPGRDIFPADVFFDNGDVKISRNGAAVARLITKILSQRSPSSRFEIVNYIVSSDKKSTYAKFLGKKRNNSLGFTLVQAGIEPRRLVFKTIVVPGLVKAVASVVR